MNKLSQAVVGSQVELQAEPQAESQVELLVGSLAENRDEHQPTERSILDHNISTSNDHTTETVNGSLIEPSPLCISPNKFKILLGSVSITAGILSSAIALIANAHVGAVIIGGVTVSTVLTSISTGIYITYIKPPQPSTHLAPRSIAAQYFYP